MDRRTLDGDACRRRDRADAARTGDGAPQRAVGGAGEHPVVRKILERFPGAKIVDVRGPDAPPAAPTPAGDDEVGYADAPEDDEL